MFVAFGERKNNRLLVFFDCSFKSPGNEREIFVSIFRRCKQDGGHQNRKIYFVGNIIFLFLLRKIFFKHLTFQTSTIQADREFPFPVNFLPPFPNPFKDYTKQDYKSNP